MNSLLKNLFISLLFVQCFTLNIPAHADTPPQKKTDTVTLQLKWLHQFQFAGFYQAIERGFYAEAGLNVLLKEGKPGQNIADEVVSGNADFGIDMPAILIERQHGKPIVVLAAILQHSPEVLLTLKDSKINSPHDLIGKKIMLRPKGSIEIRTMFLNEGIVEKQLNIVDHTWQINDLISKKVDAFSGYITDRPFMLQERSIPYSIIRPLTYGVDFYGDCLFTSENEISQHPQRVKAFLEASIQGWQYAMNHPEQTVDLILQKYSPRLSREALLFEAAAMQELMQPEFIEIGIMNPGRWEHIGDTFVRDGLLYPNFTLDGFLYDPSPQQVNSDLKTVLWILLTVALIAAIIAVFLFIYNRRLNREVSKRTEHLSRQITERKKTENDLKISEEKYRQLIENANESIIVIQDNYFKFFNPKALELSGYQAHELEKITLTEIIHPDDIDEITARYQKVITKEELPSINQLRIIDKEQNEKCLESNAVLINWEGKPAILIFLTDITQRQSAEKKLLEEKLFSDAVIKSLPGIFYVYEDMQRLTYWNKNFETESGFTSAEMLNRTPLNWFHKDEKERVRKKLKSILVTGEESIEVKIVFKNKEVPYLLTGTTLTMNNKRFLVGVGVDLSQKYQLEEKLNQSQKMEAIGTLAGGIAHDFNNILAAIYGYTQLAEMNIDNPRKVKEDLAEIFHAAERAKELVKQILTFSRKAQHEKQPLQISNIVKEALRLLRSTIPTTIEIKQDILSDAVVLADPTKIHQIVMNLCTNAYHAMDDTGGTLSVAVKEVNFEQNDTFHFKIAPGRYVKLEISDNGTGMSPEVKNKIFEPYFTTKGEGGGTGLGLAVVHGIVEDHNGYIDVHSELNEGTTFNLYFPTIKKGAGTFSIHNRENNLLRGSERILVIDDEEQIVYYTKEMLSHYGYKVTTLTNGAEALKLIKNDPGKFNLVITDQTMPHITGIEIAREIIAINPELPVILSTGHSKDLNREKALAAGIKEYCEKPLDINKLLITIRKVLNSS